MFIKFFIFLISISIGLVAQTYQFSEERYSDALDRTLKLQGKITFAQDALNIEYDNSSKTIAYKSGELLLQENGKIVEVSEQEIENIGQYFELLLLLYKGDQTQLQEQFKIVDKGNTTELLPKENLKNYLDAIYLQRLKKQLQRVEFFLTNKDTIAITIENEIH